MSEADYYSKMFEQDNEFKFCVIVSKFTPFLFEEGQRDLLAWGQPIYFKCYYSRSKIWENTYSKDYAQAESDDLSPGNGSSIALAITMGPMNNNLPNLQEYANIAISKIISEYFGSWYEKFEFPTLVILLPPTNFREMNRLPLPYSGEKAVPYWGQWDTRTSEVVPEALCWMNPNQRENLLGVIFTDGRYSKFSMEPFIDFASALGTQVHRFKPKETLDP